MESNPSSEGASPEPCATPAGAVKLHKKLELNPKESQDIKALQKNPEQSAKLVKQKRITLESTQAAVGLTLGVLFGKVPPCSSLVAQHLGLEKDVVLQPSPEGLSSNGCSFPRRGF
uniref:Uncharacterized protein n=1 Tax=Bos indicus x Bos taurus TaxID=30522 RepID=A0A4W2CLL2_BOBOX